MLSVAVVDEHAAGLFPRLARGLAEFLEPPAVARKGERREKIRRPRCGAPHLARRLLVRPLAGQREDAPIEIGEHPVEVEKTAS